MSLIPSLIDALVAKAQGLSALTSTADVTDGFSISTSQRDSVMIGIDDPATESIARSAGSQQTYHGTGNIRQEEGEVTCSAKAVEGSAVMKSARDRAFSYANALETALKSDYQLGGLSGLVYVIFGDQTDYYSDQTPNGAEATVVFRIKFAGHV